MSSQDIKRVLSTHFTANLSLPQNAVTMHRIRLSLADQLAVIHFMKTKLAKLLSGNILAQAIPLAALPLLARLYTPEEFGFFALYVAICSMVSMVSSGRFDVAIIAAPKRQHKATLVRLSLIFITVIACTTALICSLLFGWQQLSLAWCILLPLGISGVALFNLGNNIRNDQEAYGKLTLNMTSRSAIWVAVSIAAQHYSWGLLMAFALSYWCVALINVGIIVSTANATRAQKDLLFPVAKRYRQYPLFNAPHALLTSTNLNIPNLLLPIFGQTALLGAYSQANKVLMTPWQLIANALFKIYFKTTAKRVELEQAILPAFRKFLLSYTLLLLPIFVAAYWLVEPFILLLLGDEWLVAGQIGVLLLPWIFMRAIGGILAFVPLILSLQSAAFIYEIAYSACMAACMALSLAYLSPMQAMTYFAWLGAGFVFVQIIWYLTAVVKHDNSSTFY